MGDKRDLLWVTIRVLTVFNYTIFVGSTAAIDKIRTDAIGPGQRFTVATKELCSRILRRHNEVTVRWVPAHHRVTGNERADEYAKAAAEARSRATAQWTSSHVGPERRYRPPPGRGIR